MRAGSSGSVLALRGLLWNGESYISVSPEVVPLSHHGYQFTTCVGFVEPVCCSGSLPSPSDGTCLQDVHCMSDSEVTGWFLSSGHRGEGFDWL